MTTIYFFSPDGYAPMKDGLLKALSHGSHGWQPEGETWVYGLVEVKDGVHPQEVTDRLTAIGVIPLPAARDVATPVDVKIIAALEKHGVAAADHTLAIAAKMAAASGHPLLRPDLY